MWRPLQRNLKTHFSNYRKFCTTTNTTPQFALIKSISSILQNKNWKNLIDSSIDIKKELNPDVIASVMLHHHTHVKGDPRELVSFYQWCKQNIGTIDPNLDFDILSILAVSLCNLNFYAFTSKVADRLISNGGSSLDLLSSISRITRKLENDGVKYNGEIFGLVLDRYRRKGLLFDAASFILCHKDFDFRSRLVEVNLLLGDLVKAGKKDVFWSLCKKMSEADVFDSFTYNHMINAYCEEGDVDAAKNILHEMESKGCHPDLEAYSVVLTGLCKAGSLDDVIKRMSPMLKKGIKPDSRVYAELISGFCAKNRFREAGMLLDETEDIGEGPDLISCIAFLDGLVKQGNLDEALRAKEEMSRRGVNPELDLYKTLICGASMAGRMEAAHSLVDEITRRGFALDSEIYEYLVKGHLLQNNIDNAMYLFADMKWRNRKPSLNTFNALVDGFCYSDKPAMASAIISEMMSKNFEPLDVTFVRMIEKGGSEGPKYILEAMDKYGFVPNEFHFNFLITRLCKAKKTDAASITFQEMLSRGIKPDQSMYAAMVTGYCMTGEVQLADRYFKEMLSHGLKPSNSNFRDLVIGHLKHGNITEAYGAFRCILDSRVLPEVKTYEIFIRSLVKCKRAQEFLAVMTEFFERDINIRSPVYTNIICDLCRQGEPNMALSMYEEMQSRGIHLTAKALNALISGFSVIDQTEKAEALFRGISGKSLKQTYLKYMKMILGLCESRYASAASGLFEEVKLQEKARKSIYEVILSGCFDCGDFGMAEKLIREMLVRKFTSTFSYNRLISAYCDLRELHEARRHFKNMIENQIMPDSHTYASVIGLICKEGIMEEAKELFLEMQQRGLIPTSGTYGSLIQGYILIGDISEVYALSLDMMRRRITPNVDCCDVMLDAFSKEGDLIEVSWLCDVMLGKGIHVNAFAVDSHLENLCEEGGELDNALELIRDMSKRGVRLKTSEDTCRTIAHAFSIAGDREKAEQGLKLMYSQGELDIALELFREMCKKGLQTSEGTELFHEMCKRGLQTSEGTWRAITHAFSSTRDDEKSEQILKHLYSKGELDNALDLFREMCKRGLQTSEDTCRVIAHALAHAFSIAGDEEKAEQVLKHTAIL